MIPAGPAPETGVRILEVWYPDWAILAAGVGAAVPAAVVGANRVLAVSAAARGEGVVTGLRRREAQGRCPELEVIVPDPARDARVWEPVVAAVEAFAPGVEVGAPGSVSLGTRGPSRYFGGDRALADKVAAAVDAAADTAVGVTGPGCRVGVADGRFAAALAARSGPPAGPGPRRDGTGCTVIAPGASPVWLAHRSVAALGRPDLADLLVRLGVRTLGQLAQLPASSVLARFGTEGAEAHRLARGLDPRPLSARIPLPDLAVVAELDPPVDRVDRAAFVARSLADRLHASLTGEGLACTRLAIEAETEHGEHLVRWWRHEGALDAGAVAERVRWQLDAWLGAGGATAGLTVLRLVPDEVRPDDGRQLGFWGGAAVDAGVNRTLTRVQGLLGPDAVVTAVIGGGRDPGDQVDLVPWGSPRSPRRPGGPGTLIAAPASRPRLDDGPDDGPGPASRPPAGGGDRSPRRAAPAPRRTMGRPAHEVPPWPGRLPGPSPAVVHPTPRAAQVRDATGELVGVTGRGDLSAPPVQLVIEGGPPMPVTAWAGPWPVEERWWDGGRRRARFQVCVAAGVAYLVVREDGCWWLEATYD